MRKIKIVGLAVHSGKLKYVVFQGTKMIKEGEICYDVPASERLIQQEKPEIVITTGNSRWALPIAYFLEAIGIEVRYLGVPTQERGEKMEGIKYLKSALEKGLRGRPFFKRKDVDQGSHPWVSLGRKYSKNKDDQRRVKHRILDQLRVVLPEIFQRETKKVFSKKGRKLLKESNWDGLLELCGVSVNTLFQSYLPESEKRERKKRISELIDELGRVEEGEKEIREKIIEITDGHPVVELFDGAFSARLFTLFVAWREWQKFEHLRAFVGLSLTRIDSRKGKLRISRKRKEARTALFLLLRTKIAKEVIAERMKNYKGKKPPARCKKLEWLLEFIWKNCFAS